MEHKCKSHKWLMIGGLILVGVIALLPFFGIEVGAIGRLSPFLIFILCPIIHIGMMVFMFKGRKKEDETAEENTVA